MERVEGVEVASPKNAAIDDAVLALIVGPP
jgi:hypothetical protein